jgi:iron complex outermembrane recepter protein
MNTNTPTSRPNSPITTCTSRVLNPKTITLAVLAAITAGSTALTAAAQTAPAGAEKKQQIETILVTAQKRPEDAQKTPLAITSVSGEEIAEAGVKNARDLNGLIPNVIINTNAAATEFTIRGITSTNNTEIGNPAVGFHLDGVYLGRPDQAGLAFFDIERIEVLRGPQGTLWGRNATAGAINVITNKPKNKLEGAVMFEVGNFDSTRTEAMINFPVNDSFMIRAALATENRDGYMNSKNPAVGADKNTDDADTFSARLHALYKPNKNFSVLLTADSAKVGGYGYGTTALPLVTDRGPDGRVSLASQQAQTSNKYDGYSAEVNWTFGPAALTYIGSKRESTRNEANYSAPNTARTQFDAKPEQTSHELRLASAGNGPFTWVLGGYTYKETNSVTLLADNVNGIAGVPATLRVRLGFLQDSIVAKANAIFGQGSFAVTDKLKLTAGLRSTRDELSRIGRNTTTITTPTGTPVAPTTTAPNNASVSSSKVNWRLGADYNMDKDTLIYASAATGYKAGGFFDGVRTPTFDNTFKPENVTTYEAGLKTRALDGTLRTNVAVFRSDFKDLQVSYRGPSPSGVIGSFVTLTQNAAKASINGAEVETRWLSPIGRIDLSLAFLDAKYDEFAPPNANPPVNNTGKTLIKSPRVSGNLAYQYSWYVFNGDITARISTRYSDKYYLQPTNIALTTQPSYTRTDLALTYTADKEAWYLQAYLKNLENTNVIAGIGGLAAPNAFLAPPRTYGIRVGMKF